MIINTVDDLKNFYLKLKCYEIDSENEILRILADNIERIYEIVGICGIQKIMNFIPNLSEISSHNKSLIIIDKFLANNIDEIYKNEYKEYIFCFDCFVKMDKFKKEIEEKGIDFFINVPLKNYNYKNLNDFKDIAKSIWGEFTIEHFVKMKFGQNDSQRALIIKTIIEELFKIYVELRKKGILWVDIKPDNVGRLLDKNTSHILYVDINKRKKQIKPYEDGNGLVGNVREKPLEKGDLVIDGLFRIKKIDSNDMLKLSLRSRYGYNFGIRYNNMVEEQRKNRRQERNRD